MAAISAPAELKAAILPAMPPAAGPASAPDQTPKSPTPLSPGVTLVSAAATLSPPTPAVTPASSIQFPTQPPADPTAGRASEDSANALPAQLGVKFAVSGRPTANGTTDTAADVSAATTGATLVDTTATSGNGQLGTQIQPAFNVGVPATPQAMPAMWTMPQHAAGTADAVPLAGVPFAIAARVEAGEKQFEIRLDPPDLGRIEVRLNVDSSGRATSHLVVDRADTLDLLRRDAPALERALQSAGLTTDDGALQFSLRDQSFAGRDQGSPAPLSPPAQAAVPDGEIAPIDAALRRYGQLAGLGGGIDIRV
jgi:flagellar hook-length control protein FliK